MIHLVCLILSLSLSLSQVEVLCGSMGNALGSVGGWCVGTTEVSELVYTCALVRVCVYVS